MLKTFATGDRQISGEGLALLIASVETVNEDHDDRTAMFQSLLGYRFQNSQPNKIFGDSLPEVRFALRKSEHYCCVLLRRA